MTNAPDYNGLSPQEAQLLENFRKMSEEDKADLILSSVKEMEGNQVEIAASKTQNDMGKYWDDMREKYGPQTRPGHIPPTREQTLREIYIQQAISANQAERPSVPLKEGQQIDPNFPLVRITGKEVPEATAAQVLYGQTQLLKGVPTSIARERMRSHTNTGESVDSSAWNYRPVEKETSLYSIEVVKRAGEKEPVLRVHSHQPEKASWYADIIVRPAHYGKHVVTEFFNAPEGAKDVSEQRAAKTFTLGCAENMTSATVEAIESSVKETALAQKGISAAVLDLAKATQPLNQDQSRLF